MGEAVRSPYKFTSACFFTWSDIPVNTIDNGALGGFSGETHFAFSGVDFGRAGSDKLILSVGNSNNRDIPIELWDGIPNEGGRLIDTIMFPHNNRWDGFEPMEFTLPETLKGQRTIAFGVKDGSIFGGFEFVPKDEVFSEICAGDNDGIYGDDFTVNGDDVENIGNNVVLNFSGMDFGDNGTSAVTVCGKTPNSVNTIQLRYDDGNGQKTQLLEFRGASEYTEQKFVIDRICGRNDVSFVFLPGSKFDFRYFRFEK